MEWKLFETEHNSIRVNLVNNARVHRKGEQSEAASH